MPVNWECWRIQAGRGELSEGLAGIFGKDFTEKLGTELDLDSGGRCRPLQEKKGRTFFCVCIWHLKGESLAD